MAASSFTERSISRRNCIKLMGGFALAAGTAMVLPGCNSNNQSDQSVEGSDSGAAEQKDSLRIGITGKSTDVLDMAAADGSTLLPFAVCLNVFDSLMLMKDDEFVNQLAEEVTSNEDATQWTIRIREGATFHNGNPVTADDVLYSLQHVANSPNGMMGYMYVDWENSSSDGDRTVTLAMTQPHATFVEEALGEISPIFPNGSSDEDFNTDIGSGPYKLVSFSADTGAVLEAYEDYWDGAPSIKTVEFVPMAEAATRTTALTGGQIDFANQISATDAASIEGNEGFEVFAPGVGHSSAYKFCLNATKPPFDDPGVRKAFKAIVDRESMVETITRGKGEVGNDVMGKGLSGYNESLPQREYDLDAAVKVFQDKGIASLDVLTSEMISGIKDSVDMLAQQMEKAGVTLNVTEVDPANLFTDMNAIYNTQVFATYLLNRPYVTTAAIYTGGGSPYNFSQWNDEEYNALLAEGMATGDESARADAYSKSQERLWEEGAEVVWGYAYELYAHIAGLDGVTISHSVPLLSKATLS